MNNTHQAIKLTEQLLKEKVDPKKLQLLLKVALENQNNLPLYLHLIQSPDTYGAIPSNRRKINQVLTKLMEFVTTDYVTWNRVYNKLRSLDEESSNASVIRACVAEVFSRRLYTGSLAGVKAQTHVHHAGNLISKRAVKAGTPAAIRANRVGSKPKAVGKATVTPIDMGDSNKVARNADMTSSSREAESKQRQQNVDKMAKNRINK